MYKFSFYLGCLFVGLNRCREAIVRAKDFDGIVVVVNLVWGILYIALFIVCMFNRESCYHFSFCFAVLCRCVCILVCVFQTFNGRIRSEVIEFHFFTFLFFMFGLFFCYSIWFVCLLCWLSDNKTFHALARSLWGAAASTHLGGMIRLCRRYLICDGNFMLMLTSYMPPNRIISCERSRTERTWHTYTLMTLSNMCTQIRFIAVQSVAV